MNARIFLSLALTALPILPLGAQSADRAAGSLFIVGGGPRPAELMRRFVELAGGRGAIIVVLPMASGDSTTGPGQAAELRDLGADALSISLTREQAMRPESAALVERARGIWFSGGDQNRLVAAIGGTPLERAIHARYRAGAVVGGTSAGAAVMSAVMITGDERRPGGDRPPADASDAWLTIARDNVVTGAGFGLLTNAIVDQHFLRRKRHNRLMSLALEHPELIAVGVDESTALEVAPRGCWVVRGSSVAVIYDARKAQITPSGTLGGSGMQVHVLPAGGSFDPATGAARLGGACSPER